jgi:hypothetical protein
MSDAGMDNKQRNREIARNEERRQAAGEARVSIWAVAIAVVVGVIAAGIGMAWLNRLSRHRTGFA